MDTKTDQSIKQFIGTVAKQNPGLVTAFLFGSYAKNTQRPDSDIDIALIIDGLRDIDKFDMQVRLMLLASQFDSRIEPHPISSLEMLSNTPFVNEIKTTGLKIEI